MKRLLLLFSIVSCWITAVGQCPPAGPLSSPYFEDFSTINNGATGSSFSNCWVATTTADPNWESEKSGTANSSLTGPSVDNSYGFGNNGYYVYLETSSGSQGDTSGFISPVISLSNLTSPELSFYYHMYGATMGELEVQIWNGVQWDSVWAISGEQQTAETSPWRWAHVSLASYSGNIKVKFLGSKGGTTYTGDMSIDDVRIDEATNCIDSISNTAVKNITAFTGDVVWDGNTGATAWEVHYYETGTDFYSGTTVTATTDSVRLTGLQSNTEYRVFVRQACSSTGFGPWSAANQLSTPVSCPAPSALSLNSVTTTSADISWTSGGATSWVVEYDTLGFTPGTGRNVMIANSNVNYIISSLMAGSHYDVYVRDFCMAGDTSTYVGPLTVTTGCNALTAPYFNDFESDLLDTDPLCWTSYKTASSAFVEVEDFTGTAAPYAGSQALYLYSGNSSTTPGVDTLIAISPQFSDLTAGNKQIRFFANSDAPADSLIIGTISSPSPTATFTPLDTIYFPQADTYQEVILPITAANGYNGTDQYIVLAHNLGVTTDYIRIDDFTYEQIPACTKVTGITLDSVTAFSATFSFTANGNTFDYEWGPTGYTFGQGTATTGTATGNPMTVTGFQPATTYDIYIRNNCTGSSNGTSVWEGPFTFSTLCYFVAPFTEDFETYTPGQAGSNITGCFSGSRTSIPRWETEDATGANENSSGTGPFTDGSGNSSGMYLYLECSGGSLGNADSIITPYIDVSALTLPFIQFDYHMYGQTMGDLEISYEDNGVWTKVLTLSGQVQTSGSDPWAPAFVSAPATSDSIRIKIKGIRGSDFYSDMSIDNFAVVEAPSCIPSTFVTMPADSVTSSSAYISWTAGTGSSFIIEWGPTGFTPGIGAGTGTTTVTSNSATITGLLPSTTYDFYVIDDCGSSQATPAGPASITTLCLPVTMPYFEDFDSWPLSCWSQSGNSNWTEDQTNTPDHYAMANFWSNSTGVYELNSVPVNITQDAQVRFSWSHLHNASYSDELEINVSIEGSGVWDNILTLQGTDFNDPTALSTAPGSFVESAALLDPTVYTGQTVIIQIKGISGFGPNCYINDLYVENAPACPDPSGLSASQIIDTSAVLDWIAASGYQSSQVWFGPQGFFQGSQTLPGLGVQNTTVYDSLLIDTLSPNTCYEFGVRGICGPGDTTDWVGPFTFCTPCSIINAPYSLDFGSFTIGHYDGAENCWDFNSDNPGTTPSGGFSWEVRNTPQTTSSNTGPAGDNTLYPATGGTYIHSDNSGGSSGNETRLTSPLIDISGMTNPHLRYFFHNFATSMTYVQDLYVDVFDGVSWTNGVHFIDTIYNNSATSPWNDTLLDLTPYNTTGVVQVRFRSVISRSSGGGGDMSLDDISIFDLTCPAPTGLNLVSLTATTANISWTSGGASHAIVEYGPPGFTPGTGTQVISATNSAALTVTPGTYYDVYVQDSCGAGDLSFMTGPISFLTPCTFALNGSYTIGAAGGYATLDSIVQTLNICGVSGPVTINLPGGNHGAISIGSIPGTSAINTVTFTGSASGDSLFVNSGNQALDLNGAGYLNFNNIYFGNATGNFAVRMHDGSHDLSFDNCTFEVNRTTTSSAIIPVVASGSATSGVTAGDNVDHLSITNSTIAGGYYGITIYGPSDNDHNSGVNFDNNIFEDQYYYGLRTYYMDTVSITNNDMSGGFRNTASYGIQVYYGDLATVTDNWVDAGTYAFYIYYVNRDVTSAAKTSVIANNFAAGGIYSYGNAFTKYLHNSVTSGGTYCMYLAGSTTYTYSDIDIRNNIFVNTSSGYAFYIGTQVQSNFTLNYNLYYSPTGNFAFDGSAQADLATWKANVTTRNTSSVEGDPIFFGASDLHVLGGLANDAGDNTVGITTDIDGDTRPASGSTTVDIGADEYTPVSGDIQLHSGTFEKTSPCYNNSDTIMLLVENIIGLTTDLSVTPIVATYNVTGPVNSSGTITANTGTLSVGDSLEMRTNGIDLSIPGTYTLNAYIAPSADNALTFNDTLAMNSVTITVDSILTVSPKSHTFAKAVDTVVIKASSPFFGGGSFHITEICHFAGASTGSPSAGRPSYLLADDYIEVTGVPGSDLAGYTLEQYNTSALASSYTFPSGTVMSPNGTAIIATGQLNSSVPSPSDYYYHGTGTYTGLWSSGVAAGRVLKDPNGNIIDAVGYMPTYTFPVSAGVTAADWSGAMPSSTSTWGIRLEGPDMNDATGWVVSSAASPQDPNVVNANVIVPAPVSVTGFTWSLNGNVTTTNATDTVLSSNLTSGTHWYVATFNSPCGIYTDSVQITVPTCLPPSNLAGMALSTSSVQLTWDTVGVGASSYEVEYGAAGFAPGSGTTVTATGNSTTVSNLDINLCQEFYVRAACAPGDNSTWLGPISVCPQTTICTDDLDQYTTGLIGGQSSLFLEWAGAGGDGAVSTARAQSGTQALHISDGGTAGFSDIVAYFDTINSGAWDISFSLYVESGSGAYYNIQQNHVLAGATGTNLWGGDVYFDGAGTATVQYGNPAVAVGTFTYAQGQWIDINTVIDLAQDTIWIEYNGSSTGLGWAYSSYNAGSPLQFNGVNFYSGVITGGTYGIDYHMDDFCVSPHVYQGCLAPTGLTVSNVGCDSLQLNWVSLTGSSSIVEYGPAGFTPGTGTYVSYVNSTAIINGLSSATAYDFYVADTCANNDTSTYAGPLSVTTANAPQPMASFTYNVNGYTLDVDASGSTNAASYSWDFGDGNNGTGVNATNTYTSGGSFSITLTVTNACGSDDTTITVNDINLIENALARSLTVYPNPAQDLVSISFDNASTNDGVVIRILDLSGKEVRVFESSADNAVFEQTIDIGKLAKGVYMLEISNGSLIANKRLVKN